MSDLFLDTDRRGSVVVDGDSLNPGQVRHDVRNFLNAIKLSCAILHRRFPGDEFARDSLREIERAADDINLMVSEYTRRQPGGD